MVFCVAMAETVHQLIGVATKHTNEHYEKNHYHKRAGESNQWLARKRKAVGSQCNDGKAGP